MCLLNYENCSFSTADKYLCVPVLFAGSLLLCCNSAVYLHAGENRDGCPEGSDRHEGLHAEPGDPGDGQHPQPVHKDHRPHGSQPGAGKHSEAPGFSIIGDTLCNKISNCLKQKILRSSGLSCNVLSLAVKVVT